MKGRNEENDHADYLARKHFAGLDGIRAVAIIAVVWHHVWQPQITLPILKRGFVGVDLFFILSGFLISTLLIREKAKYGRISLKNFWMRRILRLVPAYYVMLFALLAAYLVFKPGQAETYLLLDGFGYYAFYLTNWVDPGATNLSITWSLATEEQFYLIWPLFEAFATPIVMAGFWVIAMIANQLINFGVLDPAILSVFGVEPEQHPEILESTFTPILLGVALAHLLNRAQPFEILRKIVGFAHAPIIYFGALLAVLSLPVDDISGPVRLAIHLAMALWIASVIVQPSDKVTKALDFRPIAFIGGVSYGMYLYHMWCLYAARLILKELGLSRFYFEFPLGLMITILVSAASFYVLEKRFLGLRKKFRG